MKDKPHPKRWKIALLTWIAIYPTITILLAVMNNILDKIDLMPIRTLILTLIVGTLYGVPDRSLSTKRIC